MHIGNLKYYVVVRRNVHANLGYEWALMVVSDDRHVCKDPWCLASFDKKPTVDQVEKFTEVAHRSMYFYYTNSVKGAFNSSYGSDFSSDLKKCESELDSGRL